MVKWPWVTVAKQKGNIMQKKKKTQEATNGEENTFFKHFVDYTICQ